MDNNFGITYDEYLVKFRDMINTLGLNNSVQKEYILKLLFISDKHLNADEIQQKIKYEHNVKIGIATVYRVLNLFEEMSLVRSINIQGQDSKVYEINLKKHHDHLVCVRCGKIVEFIDKEIEALQEQVAKTQEFQLQSHNMIMYGICRTCQKEFQHE